MPAISSVGERDGLAAAARRLVAASRWRLGALVGVILAAFGLWSIVQWKEPETVMTGTITAAAGLHFLAGARAARRALARR